MGYLRAVGPSAIISPPATAGGAVPTMSAHLAMPSYGAVRCGHYCWPSPGSMDSASAEEAPAADLSLTAAQKTPSHPDASPASSSSGTLIQYTPDSATSPTADHPSHHPTFQKIKDKGESGARKAKSRTAFSQEQLQTLHQRFQSQKYLSPHQIRELAAALGLTYKQVKTWFQNQRMKFKRCQKESQWVDKGIYLPQNGFHQAAYLDMTPTFHQGFPVGANRNLQAVTSAHQAYTSGQTYGNGQGLYPFMAVEDEGFFGKGGTSCNTQQAMGLLSQQMNFYHGYSTNVDYDSLQAEDAYSFQSTSDSITQFSSSPIRHQYQAPWHTLGTQSGYET
ncbi:homeobox protein NANOG [Meleagris gallopavo]|uniref:Homeobox domain-containing protein n=1 Tax=Meleagris gallopavo TaxID=9103 RepID=A0A803Y1N2_MELGA|nr:homeobox protein NANOG [Meleagris gallopavo]